MFDTAFNTEYPDRTGNVNQSATVGCGVFSGFQLDHEAYSSGP